MGEKQTAEQILKKRGESRARAKEHFPSLFSFFFPPLSILRHSPLSEQLLQATNSQKKLKTIALQNCLEGVG